MTSDKIAASTGRMMALMAVAAMLQDRGLLPDGFISTYDALAEDAIDVLGQAIERASGPAPEDTTALRVDTEDK